MLVISKAEVPTYSTCPKRCSAGCCDCRPVRDAINKVTQRRASGSRHLLERSLMTSAPCADPMVYDLDLRLRAAMRLRRRRANRKRWRADRYRLLRTAAAIGSPADSFWVALMMMFVVAVPGCRSASALYEKWFDSRAPAEAACGARQSRTILAGDTPRRTAALSGRWLLRHQIRWK